MTETKELKLSNGMTLNESDIKLLSEVVLNVPVDIEFSKITETAIIPKKANNSDAGYDIYLDLEGKEKYLSPFDSDTIYYHLYQGKQHVLPTGIRCKPPRNVYTNWANERGSTGKVGMMMLSGIVDTSYRGEVFVNITPVGRDMVITSNYSLFEKSDGKPFVKNNVLFYPYNKAVCQMIPYYMVNSQSKEVNDDDIANDITNRGHSGYGASGH